jgi:rubredoxin
MKVLEVPSYQCAYCGYVLMPVSPQPMGPESTHALIEHPLSYVKAGQRCPYAYHRIRVPVHMVDGEVVTPS